MLVLSKEKADLMRAWDEIAKAVEADEVVHGTIVSRVKGGLQVDIGVKAFLPGSQVELSARHPQPRQVHRSRTFRLQDHQVQQEAR